MKSPFEKSVKSALEGQGIFGMKEAVWKGIEQKMQYRRRKIRHFYYTAAAVILVLVTVSISFSGLLTNETRANRYFSQMHKELSETEYYYTLLIDEKEQQIDAQQYDKEFFQPFFEQLENIDILYIRYKQDIDQYGYQEQLIRAMIELQQQKIDVLNRLLLEINKIKSHEKRIDSQTF